MSPDFQVRFEGSKSPATKILFLTEGENDLFQRMRNASECYSIDFSTCTLSSGIDVGYNIEKSQN